MRSRIWPRSPSQSRSRSRTPSPVPPPKSPARAHDAHLVTLPPAEHAPAVHSEGPGDSKLTERRKEKVYGEQLLPGEGSAMASYVASGARIPRRGEIGMDQSVISRFEASGYVMSGSRNAVMNAVRLRKEGQVISAEGRRRLAMEALESRQKREEEIVKNFRHLVNERLRRAQQPDKPN